MKDWDLLDKGFGYNVVAVFGSQSTGKSELSCLHQKRGLKLTSGYVISGTLLNGLFGTKFDVMNENERRQTTKGMSAGRFHVQIVF